MNFLTFALTFWVSESMGFRVIGGLWNRRVVMQLTGRLFASSYAHQLTAVSTAANAASISQNIEIKVNILKQWRYSSSSVSMTSKYSARRLLLQFCERTHWNRTAIWWWSEACVQEVFSINIGCYWVACLVHTRQTICRWLSIIFVTRQPRPARTTQ